jgi:transmembrane sensor
MSNASPLDEISMRRLAQASAWRVRLTETDRESSAEFEAWMAADPANAEAWAEVQGPWVAIGEAAVAPEVIAARRDALSRAKRRSRRRWAGASFYGRAVAGLAAVAACAAGYVVLSGAYSGTQDYRTALGERRVVTLSDGSRVSLDSGSEVKIHYSRDARQLELLSGQARFDVAHNPRRPFSGRARNDTVIATGTAFNVDLLGQRVLVTLIQGHITVEDGGGTKITPLASHVTGLSTSRSGRIVLVAGQQLIAAPMAAPRIEIASLDRTTAWESGQLVFDDESLGSVVQRVNRYTNHPIGVDQGAAALHVSGVFVAGDTDTFIDTVTHYLPVEAVNAPDGSVALRRKGF